jgi:hypothetical protein
MRRVTQLKRLLVQKKSSLHRFFQGDTTENDPNLFPIRV